MGGVCAASLTNHGRIDVAEQFTSGADRGVRRTKGDERKGTTEDGAFLRSAPAADVRTDRNRAPGRLDREAARRTAQHETPARAAVRSVDYRIYVADPFGRDSLTTTIAV